jgi:hypothetical protein
VGVVSIKQTGEFKKTNDFLNFIGRGDYYKGVDIIAKTGVQALMEATPKDTGLTASSWYYEILRTKQGLKIVWNNSNLNKGVNVAMLIQMGHGTAQGVYIEGIDYINPALKPVFEAIGAKVWEEVKRHGK